MSETALRPRLLRYIAAIALVLACVFLLGLTHDYRTLHSRYQEFVSRFSSPFPGMWFPVAWVLSLDGAAVCLGSGGSAAQMILFSGADCTDCPRALQTVDSLYGGLTSSDILDAVVVFFADNETATLLVDSLGIGLPVVSLAHPRWEEVFRVRDVPQLVIVDQDGRVRVSRRGIPSSVLWYDSIVPLAERLHLGSEAQAHEDVGGCRPRSITFSPQEGGTS